MELFAMIKRDHQNIDTLLKFIEETDSITQANDLFEELDAALMRHTLTVEEVFYPVVYPALGMAEEGHKVTAENESARSVLNDLRHMNPTSPDFRNKVAELKQMLASHCRHEESEVMPRLSQVMDEGQISRLGSTYRATDIRMRHEGTYLDANDSDTLDLDTFEDPRRKPWGHPEKMAARFNRKNSGRWRALSL